MSNIKVKGGQSGLSFKAGGKSPSSPIMNALSNGSHPNRPPSHPPAAAVRSSYDMNAKLHHVPSHLSILQTGISNKKSPVEIKNWITCVLTLDGRDKFTKILQYSSRLLCWYFAGLAKQCNATATTSSGIATIAGPSSLLTMLFTNIHVREQYYSALSKRFDELYKSLVTSRKAFRLGRSIIELDKLSSMGWGQYLTYMLMHPLAGGVADGDGAASKLDTLDSNGGTMDATTKSHSISFDTHPIPEEEGNHDEEDESENSWNEDEEKKLDTPSPTQRKVVARPGRPKLVSKISSNIGWGPSSAASTEVMTQTSLDKTSIPPPISTPLWKLMGGTAKLLGLCGFWFFDNISFLTGSGFLDPICGVEKAVVLVDPKASDRTKRKALATEWAARCYFLGSIGGFYYNARALIDHRKTKFKEACNRLREATRNGSGIDEAISHMEQTKQQQFEIWIALLKSCADVMVFSNNPGVDLHLKYRGKKNHEGLHCLGGLISASTVLYANFPNAK